MNANTKIGVLSGLLAIFVLAFALRGLSDSADAFSTHDIQERPRLKPAAHWLADLSPSVEPNSDAHGTQTVTESEHVDAGISTSPSKPADVPARQQAAAPRIPQGQSLQALTYTVQEGDNLALIAKQFYGQIRGNRKRVIEALFAANRKIMRTADELRVGQEMVIPSLPAARPRSEAVKPADRAQSQERGPIRRIMASQYRIRDGDSLWKIAEAKLGGGRRYLEILRLNRDLIDDQDELRPGTLVRLPSL